MTVSDPVAPVATRAEARALAAYYVAQLNQQLPPAARYRWLVAEPVEYARYWYFTYRYERPATTGPADALAGAPAYLLWKHSRQLVSLSWADNPTLPEREALWQQAQQQARGLLAGPEQPTLVQLRASLPSRPLASLPTLYQQLRALPTPAARAAELVQLLHAQALAARQLLPLPGEPT